ncbi:MAG: CDP-glycerol glycerophosphotransferase family protein [Holophagaceae bacterium]|nr:CDP-glycerol glycerophosphotransferase family protein [Holophagaceae bacterium]
MRKAEQAKIVEYLKVLHGAHKELDKAALQENHPKIISGCQELAAQVAQYISETKGPGTQTASSLEEYRQYLSQAEAAPNGIDKYFIKKLRAKLFRIETLAQSELKPNKIEVLFLPYKYSMADSLESIWLAAMADPQCDVKICPIPYYDRLPGGTFGQMHYEGDCYPKSLPLVDWQAYDIESSRPDAIFIHNPYDEGNYVTSVHPNFYSKRLRGLTDMLVYVPYFVVMDDIPDHFVTVPGCIYAHKVIVQSEKVRQTYIRTFKDKFGDAFGKPEDKFLALGSPKFDKVLNTKREDYQLPEEWQRLIGNKKVIFYNSTISAILNGNEQYLKKLRQILDTFRSRDDVVLWWRPHPLNDATYSSMRPQLLAEYKQIISDYKSQAWGIFDDTPDPHMVIAYSDAYYGDWSSLVPMYQVTDKPVMIGNLDILSTELKFNPTSMYVSDDSIWFSVRHFNALFKMDKNNWELELVGKFPGEDDCVLRFSNSLYYAPVENKGVLYFPPFLAKEIAVYSLSDGTFRKIQFQNHIDGIDTDRAFLGAASYKNFVFFTPYRYPAIAQLNTETNEITYHSDWVDKIKHLESESNDAFFLNPLVIDNTIWLASCRGNALLEFNMESCTSLIHEVGQKGCRYSGICFDGANFWLSPRHNTHTPLIKYNPHSGFCKEFYDIHNDGSRQIFQPVAHCAGYAWLLPCIGRHAVKINVQTDTTFIADEFGHSNSPDEDQAVKYLFLRVAGDCLYAFNQQTGAFIEYNCGTKERREEVIRYCKDVAAQLEPIFANPFTINQNHTNSCTTFCHHETDVSGLGKFLDFIIAEDNTENAAYKDHGADFVHPSIFNSYGTVGLSILAFAKNNKNLQRVSC